MPTPPERLDKMYADRILDQMKLSGRTRTIAGLLVWHSNRKNGNCYPGYARLARLARCNVRTVRRAIKELLAVGALEWRQRRANTSSMYQLNWPLFRAAFVELEKFAADKPNELEQMLAAAASKTLAGTTLSPGGDKTVPTEGTELSPKHLKLTPEVNTCPERADFAGEDPPSEFSWDAGKREEIDELAPIGGLAGEIARSAIRSLAKPDRRQWLSKAEASAHWLELRRPSGDGGAVVAQFPRHWEAAGHLVDHETTEWWEEYLWGIVEAREYCDPVREKARRLVEEDLAYALLDRIPEAEGGYA